MSSYITIWIFYFFKMFLWILERIVERRECHCCQREDSEGKRHQVRLWARLHPGREPFGAAWRLISQYLGAQKSSHPNSQGFLVTEVSGHSGNLGNNQPDNMGVLMMRRLLLRWRPAVILFLSVWVIQFILTAITEIDCQRNGQFERTHWKINIPDSSWDHRGNRNIFPKSQNKTAVSRRERIWPCQIVASSHMNTQNCEDEGGNEMSTAKLWMPWKQQMSSTMHSLLQPPTFQ